MFLYVSRIVSHGWSLGHSHGYSYATDTLVLSRKWQEGERHSTHCGCATQLFRAKITSHSQCSVKQDLVITTWNGRLERGAWHWLLGLTWIRVSTFFFFSYLTLAIYLPHHWALIFIFYDTLHEAHKEQWAELNLNTRESDSTVNNFSV